MKYDDLDITFEFKKAIVEDINNTDKNGTIQVRLIPHMLGVDKAMLPWYGPWKGTSTEEESSFDPPQEGSIIGVFCTSDSLREGYYINADFLEGLFDYDNNVKNSLNNISELSDKEYPNIRFRLYVDGSISFYNANDGDFGFWHNSGVFTITDKDGHMFVYTKDKEFKLYNDKTEIFLDDSGDVSIATTQGSFELNDDGTFKVEGASGSSIEINSSGQVAINGTNLTVDV